jgi:hypothetical protein
VGRSRLYRQVDWNWIILSTLPIFTLRGRDIFSLAAKSPPPATSTNTVKGVIGISEYANV